VSGGGHGGKGGAVVLLTSTRPDADSIGALFIKDLTATRPDIAFTLQWQPAFLMGARAPGILSRLIQAAAARLSWYGAARLRLRRPATIASVAAASDVSDTSRRQLTCIVIANLLTILKGCAKLAQPQGGRVEWVWQSQTGNRRNEHQHV